MTTSKPSEQQAFLKLTSGAVASPAQTCRWRIRDARAWLVPVLDCGTNGSDSSPKFSLVRSSLRTSTQDGTTGCPNCGASFTTSGMPACRFKCPPRRLAHRTVERAAFYLPTPTAGDAKGTRNATAGRRNHNSNHHNGWTLSDVAFAGLLPTPTARDWKSLKIGSKTIARGNSRPLPEALGGRIHPHFVEWMMGFQSNWTGLTSKPSDEL